MIHVSFIGVPTQPERGRRNLKPPNGTIFARIVDFHSTWILSYATRINISVSLHTLAVLWLLLLFLTRTNCRHHRTSWLRLGRLPRVALKFGFPRSLGHLLARAQPTTSGSLASPLWIMLTSGNSSRRLEEQGSVTVVRFTTSCNSGHWQSCPFDPDRGTRRIGFSNDLSTPYSHW